MSEVISFRLDKANPREAQALEVLNAWIERGFSTRFIITKALLELDHPGSGLEMNQDDQNLGLVIEQVGQLLEMFKTIKVDSLRMPENDLEDFGLNEKFLASVKQNAKPGIKLA